MKINSEWRDTVFYRYYFSSVNSSGETISLNLSNDIKNTHIFAYLSDIPYVENMMSIKLIQHKYTLSSFSHDIEITYGCETNGVTSNRHYYANWKETYKEYIDSLSGIGFNYSIVSNFFSSKDKAYVKVLYRYYHNNKYTDWVQCYYKECDRNSGSTVESKVIHEIFKDIYPLDTKVLIEIKTIVRADSLSSVGSNITYYPIYYEKHTKNEGKVHWFMFVD